MQNLENLKGSLPYISPEQTGWIKIPLDYRSDFYSLGVVLYEMLTGQKPFEGRTSLEWIHHHMATVPLSPHQISPIPLGLSRIILKLLSKPAEERYQSAQGLMFDLQKAQELWKKQDPSEDFPPGLRDFSPRLTLSSKLYGRQKERAQILEMFAEPSKKQKNLLMIAGPAGSGKTALAKQIEKDLSHRDHYFISGKFDQYHHRPYQGLNQALQGLIGKILPRGETFFLHLKKRAQTILQKERGLLIEILPDLKIFLDPSPPGTALSPTEREARFHRALVSLLKVLAQDLPLVIFLDDLQWADEASLKALEFLLMEGKDTWSLIGTVRSDKPESLPLPPYLLSEKTTHFFLYPLKQKDLSLWIKEALHCPPEKARELTDLLELKRDNTPFEIRQSIENLCEKGLLKFEESSQSWTWSKEDLQKEALREQQKGAMTRRMDHLGLEEKEILALGACIGTSFDLNLISHLSQREPQEVDDLLKHVVEKGFLTAREEIFSPQHEPKTSAEKAFQGQSSNQKAFLFLHDKLQQWAYHSLAEEERKKVHLSIGEYFSTRDEEADILSQVYHLNRAETLINGKTEKRQLAHLNLQAALKAKEALDYSSALSFIHQGISLLSPGSWEEDYSLTLALHSHRAELEFLKGNLEESEKQIQSLIPRAKEKWEKADLHNLLLIQLALTARYEEALQKGREALELLGIFCPTSEWDGPINEEHGEIQKTLEDKDISSLLHLPSMKSRDHQIALKLMENMMASSFLIHQEFHSWLTLKAVSLSLSFGNTQSSAGGYYAYAILLAHCWGAYQEGYKFGLLALELSRKHNNLSQTCRSCHVIATFLLPWVRPLREGEEFIKEGLQAGLQSADYLSMCYLWATQLFHDFYQGKPLEELSAKIPEALQFFRV